MAGLYPDVPGRRMAWDEDGSVGLFRDVGNSGTQYEFTSAKQIEANDEDSVEVHEGLVPIGTGGTAYWWVIFPELRDVFGTFVAFDPTNQTGNSLAWSSNTTTGDDGSWTARSGTLTFYSSTPVNYRNHITSLSFSAIRAIRLYTPNARPNGISNPYSWVMIAWHLYGELATGETPDRLLFIDPTTGLELDDEDYAERARGEVVETEFRLKNNSTTLTASSITFTGESLYLAMGSWLDWSENGGSSFADPLVLTGSLAPGVTSGTLIQRLTTNASATLGLYAARTQVGAVWS